MKNQFLTALLLFAVCAIAAPGASRAEQILTGKVYEKIDGTNPVAAIILPGLGLSASPSPKTNEVAEAFSEFADPRAAMLQIEALKRKHGFSGGTVFAGFIYDSDQGSALSFVCGISAGSSGDLDELREYGRVHGSVYGTDAQSGMDFRQFKLASHEERVRAIGRCLASMEGMPHLRPARHEIKKVYIDELSYRHGEAWLRSKDPEAVRGTSAQYRKEFLCLVSGAARDEPEATGQSVIFRTIEQNTTHEVHHSVPAWAKKILPKGMQETTDTEDLSTEYTYLSVLNDGAVNTIWNQTEPERINSLWPTRGGMPNMIIGGTDNPLEQALGPASVKKWLPSCHREAGLFELPEARLPEVSPPAHCNP